MLVSKEKIIQIEDEPAECRLRGIAADLPSNADMVGLCNQLPDLIGKIF